ncbi:MAG: heavy-metal-associated domain-containing protein [Melioribacteraceae bacterium]|nr:heavy-metal-associated domain-containing protein [Melioribacteraceae bacterium]
MKVIYNISGMTCMHCVKAVEIELKEAGIKNFHVEIGKVEAEISDSTDEQKIIDAIKEAGYEVI